MYLPWAIFPISLFLVCVGQQRNGQIIGLLVVGSLYVASKVKDHWIRAYYLWSLVLTGFIYSILTTVPIQRVWKLYFAAERHMVQLTVGMLIILAFSKISPKKVFNAFCLFALFQCYVWIFQTLGFDLMQVVSKFTGMSIRALDFAGTLGNKNFLAACLAITAPMFFREKWWIGLFIIVPVLFCQSTTTATIALLVAACYWMIKTKPEYAYLLFSVILLVVVGFLLFVDHGDGGERIGWWMTIFNTKSSLLIGVGPGAYMMNFGSEHAHNEYVQVFAETGIVGGLIIIGFMAMFCIKAYKAQSKQAVLIIACLIAVAVNALGNYPLRLAPSGFISAALLGLYSNGRLFDV